MSYDILEDTEIEEESLSKAALSFVREAQSKKDSLMKALAKDKETLFYTLTGNGMARSSVYTDGCAALDAEYAAAVAKLKEDLSFQVDFMGGGSSGGGSAEYSYPYNPDYSLDYAQRYYVVSDYYMSMTDANVRFALFQADTLAQSYLGDFYATLYDKLRAYAEYG